MSDTPRGRNRNILIVARWPLGGIRTYMRYTFQYFPESYTLTVIAASTQEDEALKDDVTSYGAELHLVKVAGLGAFSKQIHRRLKSAEYDLILSQGFISAVEVYGANVLHNVPHVLTIHGVVEQRYLQGRLGWCKRRLLGFILTRLTAIYGVSNDILTHLYDIYPHLRKKGPTAFSIFNGIVPEECDRPPVRFAKIRVMTNMTEETLLFGFLGRFMRQKGFDLVVEAVDLVREQAPELNFAVVAIGSGDYEREYKELVSRRDLRPYIRFLPFQRDVYHLLAQFDVVVMPSRWEACPLLPMETLCMGTPLIASDCIGLREVIADTPTLVFPSGDSKALAQVMLYSVDDSKKNAFRDFSVVARSRFDVRHSSEQLVKELEKLLGSRW